MFSGVLCHDVIISLCTLFNGRDDYTDRAFVMDGRDGVANCKLVQMLPLDSKVNVVELMIIINFFL